jgi:hypothetical protein
MGHDRALVIGDNPIDQLMKFQKAEYAQPTSRHFVTTDITEHVRAQHELWCKDPQAPHARRGPYNGLSVLEFGQPQDLAMKHQDGWVILAPDGTILRACIRDIPDAFVSWFEGTVACLKLKPGASGLSIDAGGKAEIVTGSAGSARKGDVDFAGICGPRQDEAAAWWDRAMAACGAQPWTPHREILARFRSQAYSEANEFAAISEWATQPSVAAIFAATRIAKPSYSRVHHFKVSPAPRSSFYETMAAEIDELLLSRTRYVAAHGLGTVLRINEIIQDWKSICPGDLTEFIDSLPDDTLLTLAAYHC